MPLSKAHIGFLGEYYCTQVIEESQKLLDRQSAPEKSLLCASSRRCGLPHEAFKDQQSDRE